jgi:hypothetical protein
VTPPGFDSPPLLVAATVREPSVEGVYVNVFASLAADHVRLVGLNVPPAPPSLGVIVPVNGPFGVIVKLLDATFTVPLAGPVSVYAVAATPSTAPSHPPVGLTPETAVS